MGSVGIKMMLFLEMREYSFVIVQRLEQWIQNKFVQSNSYFITSSSIVCSSSSYCVEFVFVEKNQQDLNIELNSVAHQCRRCTSKQDII